MNQGKINPTRVWCDGKKIGAEGEVAAASPSPMTLKLVKVVRVTQANLQQ